MFCEAHVQLFWSMCVFNECVKLCMGSSYHAESEPMNMLETEGALKFWNWQFKLHRKRKGKLLTNRSKQLQQRLFSKSRKRESWWGGVYPKSVKCLQKKALGRRKMGWRQERNAGINGPKLCISWERLKEAAVKLHLLPLSSSLSLLPFLFPIQCLWICLWKEVLVQLSEMELWHPLQLNFSTPAYHLPGQEEDELTMMRPLGHNSVPKCRWPVALLLPKDIPPGL